MFVATVARRGGRLGVRMRCPPPPPTAAAAAAMVSHPAVASATAAGRLVAASPAQPRPQRRSYAAHHNRSATADQIYFTKREMEIYRQIFESCGVDRAQFRALLDLGEHVRIGKGTPLVHGGQRNDKVLLLLSGEAIAYETHSSPSRGNGGLSSLTKPEQMPRRKEEETSGDKANVPRRDLAVCRYVGAFDAPDLMAEEEDDVPMKGWLIGATPLVDQFQMGQPYPQDIIATKEARMIEWPLADLDKFLADSSASAARSCFYRILYIQLLGGVDREKAANLRKSNVEVVEKQDAVVERPELRQIASSFMFIAIPFLGFGFADNFIMIIAGDWIDVHFGATLGLTTMAAAGFGNWISDVVGLGLGDAIERGAMRLGLSDGGFTPAQLRLQIVKTTNLAAKIIGVSLGCFLGMVPLLWIENHHTELRAEDVEVYDQVFLPHKVPIHCFNELMSKGKKKTVEGGVYVVKGGSMHSTVSLLLRGEAVAYKHEDNIDASCFKGAKPVGRYLGKMHDLDERLAAKSLRAVPFRGNLIGGSAVLERTLPQKEYPFDIIATEHTEFVEWELDTLLPLLEEDKALQVCLLSMLYDQKRKVQKLGNDIESYFMVLAAILTDGVVTDTERSFLREHQERFQISHEQHLSCLDDAGWTEKAFLCGRNDNGLTRVGARRNSTHLSQVEISAIVRRLEDSIPLLEEALEHAKACES